MLLAGLVFAFHVPISVAQTRTILTYQPAPVDNPLKGTNVCPVEVYPNNSFVETY